MSHHVRSKRRLLRRAGASIPIAVVTLVAFNGMSAPAEDGAATTSADQSSVRLLTVGAARTGGMLDDLVAEFAEESGYDVTVTTGGIDIFDRAGAGEADLVMAHLGFTELHDFVSEGAGRWPTTVLSNSVAFLIPPDDPAEISDIDDPFEAFQLIAESESPFVVNNLGETLYITDTLWNAAGRPDPGDWFLDPGLSGPPAVRRAAELGAYTIWGLHPFLMLQRQLQEMQEEPLDLEPVIYTDSLMQRIIAAVVVQRPGGKVNVPGALALERFLADPATQAEIRSFRLPNIDLPVFWPAGNQNDN